MKIPLIKDVLEYNKAHAEENRKLFYQNRVLVINLLSSPGAGKTTLIIKTLEMIRSLSRVAVIEGDISSTHDADKIKNYIDDVVQINTGGTCHLNASMVKKAIDQIDLQKIDLLLIENVGNLICPVGFDLGEDFKVVLSSVNEGDDKPVKYPNIFTKSHLVLLNKIDLLSLSDFDLAFFKEKVHLCKSDAKLIELSAKDGTGFQAWMDWIYVQLGKKNQ